MRLTPHLIAGWCHVLVLALLAPSVSAAPPGFYAHPGEPTGLTEARAFIEFGRLRGKKHTERVHYQCDHFSGADRAACDATCQWPAGPECSFVVTFGARGSEMLRQNPERAGDAVAAAAAAGISKARREYAALHAWSTLEWDDPKDPMRTKKPLTVAQQRDLLAARVQVSGAISSTEHFNRSSERARVHARVHGANHPAHRIARVDVAIAMSEASLPKNGAKSLDRHLPALERALPTDHPQLALARSRRRDLFLGGARRRSLRALGRLPHRARESLRAEPLGAHPRAARRGPPEDRARAAYPSDRPRRTRVRALRGEARRLGRDLIRRAARVRPRAPRVRGRRQPIVLHARALEHRSPRTNYEHRAVSAPTRPTPLPRGTLQPRTGAGSIGGADGVGHGLGRGLQSRAPEAQGYPEGDGRDLRRVEPLVLCKADVPIRRRLHARGRPRAGRQDVPARRGPRRARAHAPLRRDLPGARGARPRARGPQTFRPGAHARRGRHRGARRAPPGAHRAARAPGAPSPCSSGAPGT